MTLILTADLHRAYPSRAGKSRYCGLALRGTAVAPQPGGDADEQLGQESGRVGGLERAPWIRRWYYEGNVISGTAVSLLFQCGIVDAYMTAVVHSPILYSCSDLTAPRRSCYNYLCFFKYFYSSIFA